MMPILETLGILRLSMRTRLKKTVRLKVVMERKMMLKMLSLVITMVTHQSVPMVLTVQALTRQVLTVQVPTLRVLTVIPRAPKLLLVHMVLHTLTALRPRSNRISTTVPAMMAKASHQDRAPLGQNLMVSLKRRRPISCTT